MTFTISSRTSTQIVDTSLDVATFTAVGYLCSRLINQVNKLNPSLFTKSDFVNSKSASACCALFILIDRVAQQFFIRWVGRDNANKVSFSALRIALSLAGAVSLLSLTPSKQSLAIEFRVAAYVVVSAILAYTHLPSYCSIFNNRT